MKLDPLRKVWVYFHVRSLIILGDCSMDIVKICEYCGKEFLATGRNAKRMKYCPQGHEIVCGECGKTFFVKSFSSGIPRYCSKECRDKARIDHARETIKSKYGVDNISQVPEIQHRMSASIKAKSETISFNRRKTMLERYGVEHPLQSKEIREKAEQTCLDRYGVRNVSLDANMREKISKAVSSEAAQCKRRSTSRQHYGTDYPAQSDQVISKMKSTCLERYGKEWAIQTDECKQKMKSTLHETVSMNPEIKEKAKASLKATMQTRYGLDYPCQLPQCRSSAKAISHINLRYKESLENLGYEVQMEKRVAGYSFDLYLPIRNLVIDINPTYTHNAYYNHWLKQGRDANYHLDKYQAAMQGGYSCLFIWDWDDEQKILDMLLPTKNIYARNCKVKEVSALECNMFLNQFHLQNSCRGQMYRYGLYHENDLLQVMTFGRPRYRNNVKFELLRLCSVPGITVVGGASKLFQAFVKDYNPSSILSYCDPCKFSGKVYENLGMTLVECTPPNKIWSKPDSKDYITDNLLRQRGFDQLFKTNFGKGTNNEELMLQHGWLPVYDCGQAVYEWIKQSDLT